ncbi:MAG TPA: glycoside hydrolase family 9 protein, partial [Fibrobacteraceae bacterium]|nr:glycoside hydrolase family 9 protein [Fibrobacteraceae bacterium]
MLRIHQILLFLFLAGMLWADDIMINQHGYHTWGSKIGILTGSYSTGTTFQLKNSSGTTVFSDTVGATTHSVTVSSSKQTTRYLDFSSYTTSGTYYLYCEGLSSSSFIISDTIYKPLAYDAVRMLYLQRADTIIPSAYGSSYARESGVVTGSPNFSILSAGGGTSGTLNSTKGWFDAGDYGRYIPSAAMTIGELMAFYQAFPEAFANGFSNIPESSNGKSDLLDEIRYEI